MRVLVAGGLGFIGSNFVRYMVEEAGADAADIVIVDALKYGSNENNLKDLDYTLVKGDICDYELMVELVKNVDAIVNFAAEKGSFKEEDMLTPSSPYSASKTSADMFVLAYVRTYGLNAVITRCTNNYGPYQFPEKLIPKAIIRTKMDMKIPIYGTGKNVRDWIYVKDHCEAINFVLERGEIGEIYNISSGEERINLEVVSEILRIKDKPDLIEFVEDRPGHDIRYSLDSSKIRKLGWKPKHGFKVGLKETVEWYLENEWWWQHLADEKVLYPTPWKLKW